jgi:hypothetical protein
MPPGKIAPCTRKVWLNYEQVACMTPIKGTDLCANRENHIMKIKTGFCANGQCEGTKPKSSAGVALKTCSFYLTCGCKCHADIWLMFKMSGMERVLMDKSGYMAPPHDFWMPSQDPDWTPEILSSPVDTPAPPTVESPAPGLVPASLARSYEPTATGRAARGQLESWVKRQCDIWLLEEYTFPCTPTWIADEIADDQGIDPPSVGAISAVFDRWTKLGFAVVEKKPTRFTKYTETGIRLGLERMKADSKRAAKRTQAERHRNLIR